MLYLIEILHQTTTLSPFKRTTSCCILSKFYIKPQPLARVRELLVVVSYRNSTSNHNVETPDIETASVVSYRNSTSNHNEFFDNTIVILVVSYRNSTSNHNAKTATMILAMLYLIEILHQTTTTRARTILLEGCILSKFYIKPQLSRVQDYLRRVVSYRNSTSNHNVGPHID